MPINKQKKNEKIQTYYTLNLGYNFKPHPILMVRRTQVSVYVFFVTYVTEILRLNGMLTTLKKFYGLPSVKITTFAFFYHTF